MFCFVALAEIGGLFFRSFLSYACQKKTKKKQEKLPKPAIRQKVFIEQGYIDKK